MKKIEIPEKVDVAMVKFDEEIYGMLDTFDMSLKIPRKYQDIPLGDFKVLMDFCQLFASGQYRKFINLYNTFDSLLMGYVPMTVQNWIDKNYS